MRDELLFAREDVLCFGMCFGCALVCALVVLWLVSKMDPVKYIFEKPALTG